MSLALVSPLIGLDRLRAAAADGSLDVMCEALGLTLLGVFGSAADPKRTAPPADLDVCVRFVDVRRPNELSVIDALVALTDVDRIDLAVLDGSSPVLAAEALMGIGLFEAETAGWAHARMTALAQLWDTEPLRHLQVRHLASR